MRRNGKTCNSKRPFLDPSSRPSCRTKRPKWALRDHPRALASGYSDRDLDELRNQVRFPRALRVCKKVRGCAVLLSRDNVHMRTHDHGQVSTESPTLSCGIVSQSWGTSRRLERSSTWVHSSISIIQPSWSPRHRSLAAASTGDGNVEAPIETW